MKFIRSISLVLLCFAFVPSIVFADPLTYKVGGKTVSVVDCDVSASGELVIPPTYEGKPVTSIGNNAFKHCSSLTSVEISDSVRTIGVFAFSDCSSLMSVTIPDSVKRIGLHAFYGCGSLMSIEVGKGNTKYSSGNGVLFNRNKSMLIQFPRGKSGHYTIPESVTSIGSSFNGCSNLTSVTIPDRVKKIEVSAFGGCSSLTSVTIGNGVTSIGVNAFEDCSSLTSVTIGNSVTIIGDYAFRSCSSLTSVTIPDNVNRIGNYAFAYSTNLTSVTIGNGVTSIGAAAFINCRSLLSVMIPERVFSIGMNAFNNCSSLKSVTISDSIKRIGNYAFLECKSLKSITFEGNAPTLGRNVFKMVSKDARIFFNPDATGFGETFGGLPVQILKKKIEIKSFGIHAAPFSLTFETESDSTYVIEASHDLQKWSDIGEVQGTGSSVKFIQRRKALFPKQYYRVKKAE